MADCAMMVQLLVHDAAAVVNLMADKGIVAACIQAKEQAA